MISWTNQCDFGLQNCWYDHLTLHLEEVVWIRVPLGLHLPLSNCHCKLIGEYRIFLWITWGYRGSFLWLDFLLALNLLRLCWNKWVYLIMIFAVSLKIFCITWSIITPPSELEGKNYLFYWQICHKWLAYAGVKSYALQQLWISFVTLAIPPEPKRFLVMQKRHLGSTVKVFQMTFSDE